MDGVSHRNGINRYLYKSTQRTKPPGTARTDIVVQVVKLEGSPRVVRVATFMVVNILSVVAWWYFLWQINGSIDEGWNERD